MKDFMDILMVKQWLDLGELIAMYLQRSAFSLSDR